MNKITNPYEKIYKLVALIPKGKVTTYGFLSKLTGINPRIVGYILHQNKDPKNVPCHRVIKSNGKIAKGYAFGGLNAQKQILEKEGIEFDNNEKVNLEIFGYLFKNLS